MKQTKNTPLNFVFAHGLPGSGKTHLLQSLYNTEISKHRSAMFVDMDKFYKQGYGPALRDGWRIVYNEIQKKDYFWNFIEDNTTTFLDTLCVNEQNIVALMTEVVSYFGQCFNMFDYSFTIYDFDENREACVENNKIRAKINPHRSAELTIKNAKYTSINVDSIVNKVLDNISNSEIYRLKNAPVTVHVDVKKVKVWDRSSATEREKIEADIFSAATAVGKVTENKLYGADWTVGGKTWGWCNPENYDTVCPDTPNDFDELDNILEVIAPDLTFLQYKKIRKECCSINEFHVSDYYESYDKAQWVCDLNKLVDIINSIK